MQEAFLFQLTDCSLPGV
uniref:Uncharacterized protein n=1 Tax=Anguilla anguilla TaxID=7936 RepID=A0A0E9U8Y5_ANGAN